jgi:hypothetical protein
MVMGAYTIYEGKSLYPLAVDYPFLLSPYPPVYYIVTAFFMHFFGKTLISGRLASILPTILISGLIFIIVNKTTKNKVISFITASLFLTFHAVFHWSVTCRPDMLGVLLSMLGIYYILQYPKRWSLQYALFFFLLSVYTKQSLLSAPVSAFIYLLLKDWRKAFVFGLSFVFIVVTVFFVLNYASDGKFYTYTLEVTKSTMSLSWAKSVILNAKENIILYYIILNFIPLIFALSYALFDNRNLFSIYFFVSALSLVTVGIPGSFFNYYIENLAVVCVILGFQLKKMSSSKSLYILGVLILICSIYFNQHFVFDVFSVFDTVENPLLKKSNLDVISSYVANAKGRVLTDYASLSFLNNKSDLVNPLTVCNAFLRLKEGSPDVMKIQNDCFKQNFEYIIIKRNTFMTCVLDGCLSRYKLVYTLPGALSVEGQPDFLVYMPNNKSIWTAYSWFVHGPFLSNDSPNLSLWDTKMSDSQEPDSNWVCSRTIDTSIDFSELFTGLNSVGMFKNTYAYVSTYLYSPEDVNIVLNIFADDGALVALNERLVFQEGSDTYNLPLSKGWNKLVINVSNSWGSWYLQVNPANGESLDGIKSCIPKL